MHLHRWMCQVCCVFTQKLDNQTTVADCECSGADTNTQPASVIATWCGGFADISYVAISSFLCRSRILCQHRLPVYACSYSYTWQKRQQSTGSVNLWFRYSCFNNIIFDPLQHKMRRMCGDKDCCAEYYVICILFLVIGCNCWVTSLFVTLHIGNFLFLFLNVNIFV